MKKNLYGLLLLLAAAGAARPAQAQQMYQHSQYMNSNYLLNPAAAGTEDYIDVKFSFRAQWVGINQAPQTYYVTANSSLGALHTQTKRSLYDWRKGFHAIGGTVYRDVTGPTSRTSVYGSYAYNLALTRTMRLALGVAVGVEQFAIDGSLLDYHSRIAGVSEATRVPDASVGLWFYSPNFYVGVSSAQLLANNLDVGFTNASQGVFPNQLQRHYFTTAGVRLPLGDGVTLIPSVLVKYAKPSPVSVDANIKIKIKDVLMVGASYRVDDAFIGMIGINFSPTASLSYSYDASSSEIAGYQQGGHEVLLGLKLQKTRKVSCPDRFW